MTRRARATYAAVLGAALLAGCGSQADPGPGDLPIGSAEVGDLGTAWVQGTTAHLGDRTVELGRAPETFVAGATGLYFLAGGTLWFADDAGVEKLDDVGDASRLRSSPDRRYLGYVDLGPDFGGRPAQSVVYDTSTGEQVVRTSVGNGEDGDDDLSDLYAESTPQFLGFDDAAGYAVTARGNDVYRLPLDGGDPENLGDDRTVAPVADKGGLQVWIVRDGDRYGTRGTEGDGVVDAGSRSPGGALATANGYGPSVFFDVASGERVPVRSGYRHLLLGSWLDEDELLGLAFDGDYAETPTGRSAVVRCSLRTSRCEKLDEVSGSDGPVLFASGESTSRL